MPIKPTDDPVPAITVQTDGWKSRAEAAKYFSLAEKTIDRLIAHHGLPHLRFGAAIRVRLTDVVGWGQEHHDLLSVAVEGEKPKARSKARPKRSKV